MVDVLRCQQTLGPLELRNNNFYSPTADIEYPVREGLVFMGYAERDDEFVREVSAEEKAHQTSVEFVERDLKWLRESSTLLVDFINYALGKHLIWDGAVGAELGAASGWPAWLFAAAGCEMWLCELEPNSLASGLAFDHPRIGPSRRIVCDASLLPFAAETFDFILCKEFVHHVKDKAALFQEANRVLRSGGFLFVIDPVRNVQSEIRERREPDTHVGHAFVWPKTYSNALREAGFSLIARCNYHSRAGGSRATAGLRHRTRLRLRRGEMSLDPLSSLLMYATGGSLVVIARKEQVASPPARPKLRLVDPATLTWTSDGYDRAIFLEELKKAAVRLSSRPTTPHGAR
jgi:SAM-dependent methyltransferase